MFEDVSAALEDYLERIDILEQERGEARAKDLAEYSGSKLHR